MLALESDGRWLAAALQLDPSPAIIRTVSRKEVVDWTGVAPPSDPIAPLTPATFIARLQALSATVTGLAHLERAFRERQPTHGDRLPAAPRTAR